MAARMLTDPSTNPKSNSFVVTRRIASVAFFESDIVTSMPSSAKYPFCTARGNGAFEAS